MIYFSKKRNSCFFCSKVCCEPPDNLEDGEKRMDCSCHKTPSPLLGGSTYKWVENEDFHEDLRYVFLLRELLDYPKQKCVGYLKRRQKCGRGGDGEEEEEVERRKYNGWFTVCLECEKYVREGHDLYHEIEKAKMKLEEVKIKLKEMVLVSHGNVEKDGGIVEEEGEDATGVEEYDAHIFLEIRDHFGPRKHLPGRELIKMEVGEDGQRSILVEDGLDLFMDEEDEYGDENAFIDDIGHTSESEWVPSDTEGYDVKPDMSKLLAANEEDKEEMNVDEGSGHKLDDDPLESFDVSRKSKRYSRSLQHSLEEFTELSESEVPEFNDEEDEGSYENSPRHQKKLKRKAVSSDSEEESEFQQSGESGDEEEKPSKDIEEFTCGVCSAVYRSKYKLNAHQDLHIQDDSFKCNECKYVCKTNRALIMHKNRAHSKSKLSEKKNKMRKKYKEKVEAVDEHYRCSICSAVYKTFKRLRDHKKLHKDKFAIRCPDCPFVCKSDRAILMHTNKNHSGGAEVADHDLEVGRDIHDEKSDIKDKTEESSDYPCGICSAIYKTRHRLKEHEKLHDSDDAIRCSNCPYVCQTDRQLLIHDAKDHKPPSDKKPKSTYRITKDDSPYYCEHCPAKYKTEHRFKEHNLLHSGNTSIECEECGWAFTTEQKRDCHMIRVHKTNADKKSNPSRKRKNHGPFHCDHCPAIYETRNHFREHVYINHKDKLIQCKECDQCYESTQLFDLHKQHQRCKPNKSDLDGDESQKPFKCQECPAAFGTERRLIAHVAAKHIKSQFACTHCSAVFPTESRLKFHLARMHEKVHNICKVCGYKSFGSAHLRLHMQKHTKEKMYMCEICSKTFTSPTYLTCHKQKEHYEILGVQPIKCEQCDMLLPSKASLKYHNQKVHEKKFKFFCETCGKGFLFASSLRNHSKIHSTERTEICQFCGAAYVHSRILREHMKHHHPEEFAKSLDSGQVTAKEVDINQGPFFCKFCNMEFAMRYHLHVHLKTHTEVYDKYKCNICGKGYSSQSGVKRHEETAHQSTMFNCEYCGKEFPCRDYLRYHVKNYCKKKKSATAVSPGECGSDPIGELMSGPDPFIKNEAGQLKIVTPAVAAAASSSSQLPLITQQIISGQASALNHQAHLDSLNTFMRPF